MRTERWTDGPEHVEATRIERGNAQADTVRLVYEEKGSRETVDLCEQVAELTAKELADALGYTVVRHGALTPYRAELIDELDEGGTAWDRVDTLLAAATEELIGRGCSTTAEEAACILIERTRQYVVEELHRLHREEVDRAQEDERHSTGVRVLCPTCDRGDKVQPQGNSPSLYCGRCETTFLPRLATFENITR